MAAGRHREQEMELPYPLVRQVTDFARARRLTVGVLLQGAWALLTSLHAGVSDVVFGVTLSGRSAPLEGIESMIGLFVNTLPVRVRVPREERVLPWLQSIQDRHGRLLDLEHTPLSRIREWSAVPRDRPLFQSILVVENYPPAPGGGGALPFRIENTRSPDQINYPLALIVLPSDRRMLLRLNYDPNHFSEAGVARRLRHLGEILRALVSGPDRRLGEIDGMTAAERQQLLTEWSGRDGGRPVGIGTVTEGFEASRRERPDAVALSAGARHLTYRELGRRAEALGARLVGMGVGADETVATHLPRSPELVVALLGILQAGGAYLALDPEDPPGRIAELLEGSNVGVVVTDAARRVSLPAGTGVRECPLSALSAGRPTAEAPPAGPPAPESLAYVVHTSGSTGRPKRVDVPHDGVVHLVRSAEYARLGPGETFLLLAPTAFDASTFELWAPLLNGGRLEIAPPGTPSLDELSALVAEARVTTLWLTTGLFHLVAEERPEILRSLRQVLTGGDFLSPALAAKVVRELPGLPLGNAYGPTECTTFTSCHPVTESDTGGGPIPIGRPVAGRRTFVFGPDLRPVPVAVTGELCIGGRGLTRGYGGHPRPTAERFVPDPVSGVPGGRTYRTGDLARWRSDATLELLGRRDREVKVRGFRVDPAEVEARLMSHPAVVAAAVLTEADRAGGHRLHAYWIPVAGAASTEGVTMEHSLLRDLPAHMTPATLVRLDHMPLTPSGKLDRDALRRAAPSSGRDETARTAPRNHKERRLARIWCDLLDLPEAGVHDDFFDVGGHSLLAMQLVARIREAFDAELPVTAVYGQPTIEGLVREIEREQHFPYLERSREILQANGSGCLVPLREAGEMPPLFCVHGGGGHLLEYRDLTRELGPKQPVYGLQSAGLEGGPVSERIEEMAEEYLAAVARVQPTGPYRITGYCIGGLVAFEMARRLRSRDEGVSCLVILDATPAEGPVRDTRELRRHAVCAFSDELATPVAPGDLAGVAPEDWLDHVWAQFRARAPEEAERLGEESFHRLCRVFVANHVAASRYRAAAYDGPLAVFEPRYNGYSEAFRAAALGWKRYCSGSIEHTVVPGSHVTMLRGPRVRVLAQRLTRILEGAGERLAAGPGVR